MSLYPFNRITIEWCAEGEPISAFNWPQWIEKVKNTQGPRLRFKVSTEEAIYAILVEVKMGRLPHTDVCFLYKDTILSPSKLGGLDAWPKGFADTIDNLLNVLTGWGKE